MQPYEAYQQFLAIKAHFTQSSYDFFKYGGKVKANFDSFNKRRDKFHFAKLAKHKDPMGFLVAQYASGDFNGWIGECMTEQGERTYTDYLARHQAITYNFQSDIRKLEEDFISYFKVKEGQHPPLLVMFKRGAITIETFTILNDILHFFQIWDSKIEDTVIWPSIRERCLKYRPFIQYDKVKIKSYIHSLTA